MKGVTGDLPPLIERQKSWRLDFHVAKRSVSVSIIFRLPYYLFGPNS